jgi:hypothetical protein
MALRQKYVKILSEIFPAGAMGVSLLLGSTAPGEANQHPASLQPATFENPGVSERLAAIRDAVSDLSAVVEPADQRLAWGNWWRNGGWPNWWRNW